MVSNHSSEEKEEVEANHKRKNNKTMNCNICLNSNYYYYKDVEGKLMLLPHIPTDLIVSDILARLPVRSLFKFRSVCKSWYSLVEDENFIKNDYHHKSKKRIHFLSLHGTSTHLSLSTFDNNGNAIKKFTKEVPSDNWRIQRTSMDLVLLYGSNHACVLNPTTEEMVILPSYPIYHKYHQLALGYSSSLNQYKVIRLSICKYYINMRCQIITVANDVSLCYWKEIDSPPFHVEPSNGVFINDYFHMVPDSSLYGYRLYIARFNIDKEEWSVIQPPPLLLGDEYEWYACLGVSSERLFLTVLNTENFRFYDLWFLHDYHNDLESTVNVRWVKEYTIDFGEYDMERVYFQPFTRNSADDERISIQVDDQLYYYDLKLAQFEKSPFETPWCREFSFYIESLISLGTK